MDVCYVTVTYLRPEDHADDGGDADSDADHNHKERKHVLGLAGDDAVQPAAQSATGAAHAAAAVVTEAQTAARLVAAVKRARVTGAGAAAARAAGARGEVAVAVERSRGQGVIVNLCTREYVQNITESTIHQHNQKRNE